MSGYSNAQIAEVLAERDRQAGRWADMLLASQALVGQMRAMLDRVARSPQINCDGFHPDTCDCIGDAVRALLADPDGQRAAEGQLALERVERAARDHRHNACTLAHQELDDALAAVQRARQGART